MGCVRWRRWGSLFSHGCPVVLIDLLDPDDLLNGCYLPGNSGCRTKGARYKTATRDALGTDGASAEENMSCKKEVRKGRFKLPGVFIYSCPHGLILGYAPQLPFI